MVTTGTHEKCRIFNSAAKLDLLTELLKTCAREYEWRLTHGPFSPTIIISSRSLRAMFGRLNRF